MTDTVNLGLPCIEGSQAQKHVTHNDALRILDTLVQLAVLDRDLSAPPGSPSEGQRWIVKATATGAWAGHDNAIAAWQDGGWQFSAPRTGWSAFVADEGALVLWNGTAWSDFFSVVSSIQNLVHLGLGTTADNSNPLSAKLNNTLFVAKSVAEGGDGNLRYKLSKESSAKTLSFLLQDNYSGRAEIGLTGDDDFHFKVSPDGTTWYEGFKIAAATGKVSFPVSGGPREVLSANRTYYVRSDGNDGNSGLANSAGGAFLTWQHAIDVVHEGIDLNGCNVTLQAGGSSGTFNGAIVVNGPFVGAKTRDAVQLIGDTTTPSNFVLQTTSSSSVLLLQDGVELAIKGFKLTSSGGGILCQVRRFSYLLCNGNMEFGSTSGYHFVSQHHGMVALEANYTISGGATAHWNALNLGYVLTSPNLTITLTGTPNFTSAFAVTSMNANIQFSNLTFSGSATGVRYSVITNAVINANGAGASALPGNSAGSTATGGQYV